jgi:hypothetical protein
LRIKGDESAEQIFSILKTVLDYAHKSNINIFSMGADGARSEFNAQTQITTYFTDDPFYNVHLKVPIINGKPLVRIQDQKHAKKTARKLTIYWSKASFIRNRYRAIQSTFSISTKSCFTKT